METGGIPLWAVAYMTMVLILVVMVNSKNIKNFGSYF